MSYMNTDRTRQNVLPFSFSLSLSLSFSLAMLARTKEKREEEITNTAHRRLSWLN